MLKARGRKRMADKDTALPVRSQADGTDERLHCKIVDGVADPAINRTQVDEDYNLHVEIHGNAPGVTAVDHVIRTSELGAITPDGVYHSADNTKPGNSGVITSTRAITPDDSTQSFRVTGVKGTVPDGAVHAMDVALHDEAGNAYGVTNPLPVVVSEVEGGTPVQVFQASAVPLAVSGVENHDYPVTAAKTMKFWQVLASASGKIKVEVFVNAVLKATYFNSTANTNVETTWKVPFTAAAAQVVRVRITNRDNQPMDVYSTIIGVES